MLVVVGRIGRPHGIRGEVTVEVRTDSPDIRFAPGSVLVTEPARLGPLTVTAVRWHSGRLLLSAAGVHDRTGAEALRGLLLSAEVDEGDMPEDPEEYFDRQLIGLAVVTVEGVALGSISDVVHLPSQDLLSVRREDGREALVPFVVEIVPRIDIEGGRVIVDLPPGLLELDEPEPAPVRSNPTSVDQRGPRAPKAGPKSRPKAESPSVESPKAESPSAGPTSRPKAESPSVESPSVEASAGSAEG